MEHQPRPPLHPVLRALLRVATAPDSALRCALGNYAVTFVQWHLWDAVRYNLIPGTKVREIWSREAWRGATEWPANATAPLVRSAMAFCNRPTDVPHLAPDGRLFTTFYDYEANCWEVRVWDAPSFQQPGLHLQGQEVALSPRVAGLDEVVNHLGPGDLLDGTSVHIDSAHLTVAWETGELFVVAHDYNLLDRPWVLRGPFGRPGAAMRTHPVTGLAQTGYEVCIGGASIGCDRSGRRLYLIVASPYHSPDFKLVVVSTGSWSVGDAWEVPYTTDMAVTDTEHIILAHWTGAAGAAATAPQERGGDRWIGVYSRRGELVRRWAVECTPTRCWEPRGLRYDPRTNQLALFLDLESETAAYIYA